MKSFDWNDLNSDEKKKLSKEKPVFIWGSRWISETRVNTLKKIAEKRKVLWGVLKDDYIPGLEDSLQFDTYELDMLELEIRDEENIVVLEYYHRDLKYILNELDIHSCILVNGSWYKALHFNPEFWILERKKIPYKLISPFTSETEAKEFASDIANEYKRYSLYDPKKIYSDPEIMKIVKEESRRSYDWIYQIGVAIVKDGEILQTAHNNVVPYETYSAHFGSVRERNFSAPGDLNHYDTIHAEQQAVIAALKKSIKLEETTLYINVLPCTSCTMFLCQTDIKEIVYSEDHSNGFAIKMFEKAGKAVRRFIP